jgi:Uma2 family endonuclease
MSFELEPATDRPDSVTLDRDESAGWTGGEERKGYELIDGIWVPKHPDEPLEETDREGCELIDGEWVEKPMSNKAALVATNLTMPLVPHLRATNLGFVFQAEAAYRLFAARPKFLRKPDLSFVRRERFPDGRATDKTFEFPPDLAVEVISPNDPAEQVELKLDEYLRAGVRLVWIVYIPTRNVWAYRPDGTAKLYRAADTLPGGDVVPGFEVTVGELFEGV